MILGFSKIPPANLVCEYLQLKRLYDGNKRGVISFSILMSFQTYRFIEWLSWCSVHTSRLIFAVRDSFILSVHCLPTEFFTYEVLHVNNSLEYSVSSSQNLIGPFGANLTSSPLKCVQISKPKVWILLVCEKAEFMC